MVFAATTLRERTLIYPPMAALATGLIIAERSPWKVRLRHIPVILSLTALAGTVLARLLPHFPIVALSAGILFTVGLLTAFHSTFFSIIGNLPAAHCATLAIVVLSRFRAGTLGPDSVAEQSRRHRLAVLCEHMVTPKIRFCFFNETVGILLDWGTSGPAVRRRHPYHDPYSPAAHSGLCNTLPAWRSAPQASVPHSHHRFSRVLLRYRRKNSAGRPTACPTGCKCRPVVSRRSDGDEAHQAHDAPLVSP